MLVMPMCLLKILYTFSTELTPPTSKAENLLASLGMHLTKGGLTFLADLETIEALMITFRGANPMKASKVATPPFSIEALDWST
mmetsp:Transcript_27421/g.57421  ORF Transcript_27421/g.57421 Transcript_27421/m.57421 type:complete len:84 (-) Transcript_27421:225-476(-)